LFKKQSNLEIISQNYGRDVVFAKLSRLQLEETQNCLEGCVSRLEQERKVLKFNSLTKFGNSPLFKTVVDRFCEHSGRNLKCEQLSPFICFKNLTSLLGNSFVSTDYTKTNRVIMDNLDFFGIANLKRTFEVCCQLLKLKQLDSNKFKVHHILKYAGYPMKLLEYTKWTVSEDANVMVLSQLLQFCKWVESNLEHISTETANVTAKETVSIETQRDSSIIQLLNVMKCSFKNFLKDSFEVHVGSKTSELLNTIIKEEIEMIGKLSGDNFQTLVVQQLEPFVSEAKMLADTSFGFILSRFLGKLRLLFDEWIQYLKEAAFEDFSKIFCAKFSSESPDNITMGFPINRISMDIR
jgi:hypothetical protein